jgi:hypothetical protein
VAVHLLGGCERDGGLPFRVVQFPCCRSKSVPLPDLDSVAIYHGSTYSSYVYVWFMCGAFFPFLLG